MYISRLQMNGFKSFGKKTSLTFSEGITSIVGPNGCGKTNIVDALRWVLGEQKQSVLRSTRMEEIIFNGSKTRKPSGLCEVSLTIHNDKSKLPVEYTDVEITRRLYRDGESEYLINQTPVRRKDIIDLFIDTGMGSDAYSVIELKMIEAILSEIGDDRRRLVEEAAGINKYKQQRSSAQRKLEATGQDLARVSDIIVEVDGKVKSLTLQMKRFERHGKLIADLKGSELSLARIQIDALRKQIEPLEDILKSGRIERAEESTSLQDDENQLGLFKESFRKQEVELEGARLNLLETTGQLEKLKEQELVWGEQLRAARANVSRLEADIRLETDRKGQTGSEIRNIEQNLADLAPKLEKFQNEFSATRDQEEQFNREFQQSEQRLQVARESRFTLRNSIQDKERDLDRQRQRFAERSDYQEGIANRITESEKRLKTVRETEGRLRKTQLSLEGQIATLAAQSESYATSLSDLDTRLALQSESLQQLSLQAGVAKSRREIFLNLLESHAGYPAGTKTILDEVGGHAGLLGAVASLFEIQPDYAPAVQAVLGQLATCLIVDTRANAEKVLEFAREQQLGPTQLIPLDSITRPPTAKKSDAGMPGTPLASLVSVPAELSALAEILLGSAFLVDSLPENGDDLPAGIKLVTRAGDVRDAVLVLTHADEGGPSSAVLGRQGELARLEQELAELDGRRIRLEQALADLQEQKRAIQKDSGELQKQTENAVSEMNRIGREQAQSRYEAERTGHDHDALISQLPELKTELENLVNLRKKVESELEKLQSAARSASTGLEDDEQAFARIRKQREEWQAELQERRVVLLKQENQRENLAARRLALKDTSASIAERIKRLQEALEEDRRRILELDKQLVIAEQKHFVLDEQATAQAVQSTEKETSAKLTREEISNLEDRIRTQQKERESELARQQEMQIQLLHVRKEEELIQARIREMYGEDIGQLTTADQEQSEHTLRSKIENLRGSIERIGPVNMAVAAEAEEETRRLAFLTEQRDDLLSAEDSLTETISRIDSKAREQFRETFDQIQHHFKETFSLFFEGGEGALKLVGDPDPLEASIEVIARPPGKKNRALRSLSAGEKALTAISLLFAIYLVKPSPFCILDEVDAPLDDVNISKFTKVIAQFSNETQFIIVTHNKLTMEKAHYLYGVTMEEEGLSTVVSVNIEEHADALAQA